MLADRMATIATLHWKLPVSCDVKPFFFRGYFFFLRLGAGECREWWYVCMNPQVHVFWFFFFLFSFLCFPFSFLFSKSTSLKFNPRCLILKFFSQKFSGQQNHTALMARKWEKMLALASCPSASCNIVIAAAGCRDEGPHASLCLLPPPPPSTTSL